MPFGLVFYCHERDLGIHDDHCRLLFLFGERRLVAQQDLRYRESVVEYMEEERNGDVRRGVFLHPVQIRILIDLDEEHIEEAEDVDGKDGDHGEHEEFLLVLEILLEDTPLEPHVDDRRNAKADPKCEQLYVDY